MGDPVAPVRSRLETTLTLLLGFGLAIGVFLYEGGFRGYDRSPELVVATLAGTLGIVSVVWYVGYIRAHELTGWWLVALLVGAPVLLFSWKVGIGAMFDGGDRWWPSKPGLKCLLLSTVDGCSILAALLVTRRGSISDHPLAAGAAMGIAAGALAWVLVDLWCPVGHPEHVLLGHVLPMLILAAIGAWPGGRVLRPKPGSVEK